jgi:exonuclease SbcC
MSLARIDDRQPIGSTRSEVKDHIQRLLGLEFAQFIRAVLLAQNEFATFMRADDNERARLLETLTGTGTFTQISIAAYQRAAKEQDKRKCCNFEDGDGGQPERNWAARSQAARSNSLSMN